MRNDRCVFSRSELYGRWCDDFGSGQPLHARIWAVCGICSIRAGGFDFPSIAKRRREAVSIAESREGLGGFPLRRVFFFPSPLEEDLLSTDRRFSQCRHHWGNKYTFFLRVFQSPSLTYTLRKRECHCIKHLKIVRDPI